METASMKPKNDFDFPLNPSHTKNCFLIAAAAAKCIHNNHYISNETTRYQVSDIEMITLQAAYTSLRDLLPTSPASIVSPTTARKDSWREIPIKDPLVQHAAWAYLQPMEAARSDDRSLLEKLKEKWCGVFACFSDVLLLVTRGWFSQTDHRRTGANEDDGEEEDQVV